MNGPQIQFFGNMTRDPEQLFSKNDGNPYSRITVAVNTWHGPDNPQETAFFNVTLFGRMSEHAVRNAVKGQQVFVQGRYSLREYSRQDGSPGYSHDVTAREFRIFPRNRQQTEEPEDRQQAEEPEDRQQAEEPEEREPAGQPEFEGHPEPGEDDLPFEDGGEQEEF